MKNTPKEQNLIVFLPQGTKVAVEVRLENATVWLTQAQMAQLFLTERSVITKHLRNIFTTKELEQKSNVQKMHIAHSDKPVQFYNLNVIISVGYRVNSKRGTQFRIWATSVLKQHLIDGYTVNEKRLKEHAENIKKLQHTVEMLADLSQRKALSSDEAAGLFEVIKSYSYALDVLDDYDHGRVEIKSATTGESCQLTYEQGINLIAQMKQKFGASGLFGHEKDNSFKSALGAIYQTFGGKDIYPSIEEKASNLLYLVVKTMRSLTGTNASPPPCSCGSLTVIEFFIKWTAQNVSPTTPWLPLR